MAGTPQLLQPVRARYREVVLQKLDEGRRRPAIVAGNLKPKVWNVPIDLKHSGKKCRLNEEVQPQSEAPVPWNYFALLL